MHYGGLLFPAGNPAPDRALDGVQVVAVPRVAGDPGRGHEHGDSDGKRQLYLQPDLLVVEPFLPGDERHLMRSDFPDSSVPFCPDSHALPPALVMGCGNTPSDLAIRYLDAERICGEKTARCRGVSSRHEASKPSDRDHLRAVVAPLSRHRGASSS